MYTRGGVIEGIFWSPWPWPRRSNPWPRSFKSSKIGLSLVLLIAVVIILWRAWKNFCEDFFFEIAWKKFLKIFFFLESTCAWSLALASSIPVLGSNRSVLGRAVLGLGFFCVLGLDLEPCVLDSTSDVYLSNSNVFMLSVDVQSVDVSLHIMSKEDT